MKVLCILLLQCAAALLCVWRVLQCAAALLCVWRVLCVLLLCATMCYYVWVVCVLTMLLAAYLEEWNSLTVSTLIPAHAVCVCVCVCVCVFMCARCMRA